MTVDIRQIRLSASGHQSQILACGRTDIRGVSRVAKIGMAVDEHQTGLTGVGKATAHRQPATQQNRTVTAQYQRPLTRVDDRFNAGGQFARIGRNFARLRHPVPGLPITGVETRRSQTTGIARRQPGNQTPITQSPRRLCAAGDRGGGRRSQPQIRGSVQNGYASHRIKVTTIGSEKHGGQFSSGLRHYRVLRLGHQEQFEKVFSDLIA